MRKTYRTYASIGAALTIATFSSGCFRSLGEFASQFAGPMERKEMQQREKAYAEIQETLDRLRDERTLSGANSETNSVAILKSYRE